MVPQFQQEADRTVSRERSLPVQTFYEQKPRTVTLDGDVVYNQNIIEPRVNTITEQLNVIEGGEVKETLEPIFRPA